MPIRRRQAGQRVAATRLKAAGVALRGHAGGARRQLDERFRHAVQYVPGLEFDHDPLTASFRAEAPPPASSPLELTSTAPEPAALIFPVVSNFWVEAPNDRVSMIETSNPLGERMGPGSWKLEAEPSSPLALMMGSSETSDDLAELGTEAEHAARWRKVVLE